MYLGHGCIEVDGVNTANVIANILRLNCSEDNSNELNFVQHLAVINAQLYVCQSPDDSITVADKPEVPDG